VAIGIATGEKAGKGNPGIGGLAIRIPENNTLVHETVEGGCMNAFVT